MRLVAAPVARLRRGRPVVGEPVRLDDQPELAPEKVDDEPVQPRPGFGEGEASRLGDPDEAALQLGFGEDEGVAVEEPAKSGNAPRPGSLGQLRPQCLRVDQPELVGLVDGALETRSREPRREVDNVRAGEVTGMWSNVPVSPIIKSTRCTRRPERRTSLARGTETEIACSRSDSR